MLGAVEEFAALVSQPEEQIDLARAALLIAAADHPDLEPEVWLTRLEDFAYGDGIFAGGHCRCIDWFI